MAIRGELAHIQQSPYEFVTMDAPFDMRGPNYHGFGTTMLAHLQPSREITFVPAIADAGPLGASDLLVTKSRETFATELRNDPRDATYIVLTRNHIKVEAPADSPDQNAVLSASTLETARTAASLYAIGREGNRDGSSYLAAGWAHYGDLGSFLMLPDLGPAFQDAMDRLFGLKPGGISEASFAAVLDKTIASIDLETYDRLVDSMAWDRQAHPTITSQLRADFKRFPQVSEAKLVRAQVAADLWQQDVTPAEIHLDEESVDAVSQMLTIPRRIAQLGLSKNLIICAVADKLPRALWAADTLMPPDYSLTLVESFSGLDETEYNQSVTRDATSYRKTLSWIGGGNVLENPDLATRSRRTNNRTDIGHMIAKGYFGRPHLTRVYNDDPNDLG